MSLIESDYVPPWYWRDKHLQTIVPNRLRRVRGVDYEVEPVGVARVSVDLYWSKVGAEAVALVAHGLGGHVHRPYVKGMVRALNQAGFDACAWHVWGADEPGEQPFMCHGGFTDGIRRIVEVLGARYRALGLVGFSLGGNVVLKYLGEEGDRSSVDAAVAFSVPCDLKASADRIDEPRNRIYQNSFLKTLKRRVRRAAAHTPERISTDGLESVRSIVAYDDRYTAPQNGFSSADDYYEQSSSLQYLEGIRTPTLLVNAQNDPFLTPSCYPEGLCRSHPFLDLEMPGSGGHVGFPLGTPGFWSEHRASAFLRSRK